MINTDAPLLRWHDKDELIKNALWTETVDTAQSLFRSLYFAIATRTEDDHERVLFPEECEALVDKEARRLLDLVALRDIESIDALLDLAWTIGQYDKHLGTDLRAEARKLLKDIDADPAKRGEG